MCSCSDRRVIAKKTFRLPKSEPPRGTRRHAPPDATRHHLPPRAAPNPCRAWRRAPRASRRPEPRTAARDRTWVVRPIMRSFAALLLLSARAGGVSFHAPGSSAGEQLLLREGAKALAQFQERAEAEAPGALQRLAGRRGCWTQAVADLRSDCGRLDDDGSRRLALALANCQLEASGERTYPCSPNKAFKGARPHVAVVNRLLVLTSALIMCRALRRVQSRHGRKGVDVLQRGAGPGERHLLLPGRRNLPGASLRVVCCFLGAVSHVMRRRRRRTVSTGCRRRRRARPALLMPSARA